MDKKNIFTETPKTKYKEVAVVTNKEEFKKVIKSRRSVRVFTEDKVNHEELMECLELSLLAPNSSNLQPWEFYWIKTKEKKDKIKEYCLHQSAARTAQELIVCVARPDNWKKNNSLLQELYSKRNKQTPKIVEKYYKKIVPLVYNQGPLGFFGFIKSIIIQVISLFRAIPREPISNSDMRVWAHKTTALACENLMLAVRAYGYDSCPMEGMDSKRIKKLLSLPSSAEICMVIGVGKRAENGVYDEQIRLDPKNFIKII